MGYTAVRGGLQAIENAAALVEAMPVNSEHPVGLDQIERHLQIAVGRVMAEGGLYDADLAALAIKQAEGDVIEAAFLLRAYRSTLPRLGYSHATGGNEMLVLRRVSSVFRDIPGGQVLGLTRDYTQRLLNFGLVDAEGHDDGEAPAEGGETCEEYPNVIDFLREEGLHGPGAGCQLPRRALRRDAHAADVPDPAIRLATGAGARRGGLDAHAGVLVHARLRRHRPRRHRGAAIRASCRCAISHPITGRPVTIGHIDACEVHYIAGGFSSLQDAEVPDYQLGYGLVVGRDERKAISMSIIDCSLRFAKPGDNMPVANQEFVVSHVDSVESSGFVEHLKLPHYVTFQAGVQRSRRFRQLVEASANG